MNERQLVVEYSLTDSLYYCLLFLREFSGRGDTREKKKASNAYK
uniref:Uncharacterized protein n=1 Tax=Utricularia reniformis TaxID=192314 RepID=A0A1Y0B4H6_9LAMI|nr:hypothetical protein AEK19_MT2143 [Utricularia reniformis]ART32293.1 hypothetical protein AEK19_MT2143 [Utricularia reniformis]